MGRRIVYYIPNNNQSLKVNLKNNFKDFKEWLINKYTIEKNTWGESEVAKVSFEQMQTINNFEELMELPKQNIDELVADFMLLDFELDSLEEKLYEIEYPMVSTWRYKASTEFINKNSTSEVKKLWQYLEKGRSFHNDEPFEPIISIDERIGFWNVEEQLILETELKIIAKKLESNKQLRFQKGLDLLYGIECVLQIIATVKGQNVEIVINKEE